MNRNCSCMKIIITILLALLFFNSYGQQDDFSILLDSAKVLFKQKEKINKKEFERLDYRVISSLLEQAANLKPNNTEVKYYLGYTYARMNSRDGDEMIDMTLGLVKKSSVQFEEIIELTPKYSGEIIALDPYSKITAEWGSLSMCYLYHNKKDSALWALAEGKRRGGFGEFILRLNRKVLESCGENSILITSGDNYTFPIYYLQLVENLRPDVGLVDVGLMHTTWYPSYLSDKMVVSFDLPHAKLDTMNYTLWSDSTIAIEDFSWTVKPSYAGRYMLRGGRVFLSLLKANKFQRDIFFTIGFSRNTRLSLERFLSNQVVVDQLFVKEQKEMSFNDYKQLAKNALRLSKFVNMDSRDEILMYDGFRYLIMEKIRSYVIAKDKDKVQQLLVLLDKHGNENRIPYTNVEGKEYLDLLKRLNE